MFYQPIAVFRKIMTRSSSEQISETQHLTRQFKPRLESGYDNFTPPENPTASGTGFFITDDGYSISNYHVVKDATKIRLVTSAGTVDAKVVQVDAANDLALLKADGRFTPLPICPAVRRIWAAPWQRLVFPTRRCKDFHPSWPKEKSRRCPARLMTHAIFRSACRCSRAIRAGRWWMSGAT